MAKPNPATRNPLPASTRKYPIAAPPVNKGKLSPAQAAAIRTKANRILGGL